jgi:hypothetical protein
VDGLFDIAGGLIGFWLAVSFPRIALVGAGHARDEGATSHGQRAEMQSIYSANPIIQAQLSKIIYNRGMGF